MSVPFAPKPGISGIFGRMESAHALIVIFVCLCVGMWGILAGVYILAVKEWGPGGGTLVISGWGCAAGTLEPSAYTRASSAEFCYPILEFLKSLLS